VTVALRRFVLVLALCAAVPVAACGFTDEGALEASGAAGATGPGSGPSKAMSADGSTGATGPGAVDGSSPGVPICSPPACTLPAPPAGWELVLLGGSRADACPLGFDTADPIENPVAGADACTCAACVTAGTNCSTGPIPTAYDNGGGACGTTGAQHQTNSGQCRAQSGSFGQDARVDAPTAVRGTCTATASPVPGKLTTQPRRLCTRQASTCSGGACGAPASMKACIAAPGDVACPSGTKHVVGVDVALACPSCGCSITAATCGGSLSFYPSSNCVGTPISLAVGVCAATGGVSFVSTKWTPAIATEICATTPVAPSTTLTAAQTVCCP
jgi:hypothetical protein